MASRAGSSGVSAKAHDGALRAALRSGFYLAKPLIPRGLQLSLRRRLVALQRRRHGGVWPIDPASGVPPARFAGWPDDKEFAVVLTHDVDTARGAARSLDLARLEAEHGMVSSFNLVPERYPFCPDLPQSLQDLGFEVGVHGLHHDGRLYASFDTFTQRAERINQYLQRWQAVGFRSPAMHHQLDWLHQLDIEYDASTFDTDPFEPQPDGAGTIFPYWLEDPARPGGGYVELPYTLAQDFTLFVLMQQTDIALWRQKVDWIVRQGGMVLVNTHPDYMSFDGSPGREEYPVHLYSDLLDYLESAYRGRYWLTLPRDLSRFFREQVFADAGQAVDARAGASA